ncbi:hypothetical protein CRE_20744 [Caenorhabditis remanei]|uniref:AAA+ ATPase domain-containing protein n=1 Tax=Caenorhabditis remanei TaxID=31234 RepID=E3MFC7_CAERE|nr:hypothetical protein CRE_20744 [Caenorhabditis remanei]
MSSCPSCVHCQGDKRVAAASAALAEQNDVPVVDPAHYLNRVPLLRDDQKKIAMEICHIWKDQKLSCIEGIAGTGKTYLLNAMRTLFKNVNLQTEFISSCQHHPAKQMKKLLGQRDEALENVDVFIIDNGNQITKEELDCLHHKLQRAMISDEIFGGKTVIMAADFGLILPVSAEFKNKLNSSLKNFVGIGQFKKYILETLDNDWGNFLNSVRKDPEIQIPQGNIVKSVDELIEFTFGPLNAVPPNPKSIILVAKNLDRDLINKKVLDKMKKRVIIIEAQHTSNIIRSDLELHQLRLKKGCILVLEEPAEGFPKGTRLVLEDVTRSHLNCRTVETNQCVDLERVKRFLSPSTKSPSKNKNNKAQGVQSVIQFPVSLGFGSTIHRCQSTQFEKVGLFKVDQPFEHGMVYSALSRATGAAGWRIAGEGSVIKNKVENSLI